ncbi:kallikrein-8-like isoform X2 [Pectinophora gossypiella]|uniref:kallikrein-8-like isoform X2 n=1 Tax=Pectinophora gossypiella TaxID=13191 RepID=UPI00214E100E|nr:kallikrein-8-like isoform X2 [Pectinophora gossypiella]
MERTPSRCSTAGTQPRVASLRNSTSLQHLCGATVLTAELALTAAHCVHFNHDQYLLQLNNHCEGPPPRAHILEIIPHASYDKASRSHDLALLRIQLERDDITWLGDVLPQSSFGVSGQCAIYGYGTRDPLSSETSEVLMAGDVKIVSLDECTSALGPIAPAYDAGMVCALGEAMDACQGDSGSPLICESAIQGISSYGLSCGVRGVPGVYTSIGPHLTWIRDVIRKSNIV